MDSLKSTKGLIMSIEFNGKTSVKHPIPEKMKAWVLGNPDQLMLIDKPIVMPGKAEVLVKQGISDPYDGPAVWTLHPNNPVDIIKGVWHKGRNSSDEPAHIIEIWKGETDKLSEDDIERWEREVE